MTVGLVPVDVAVFLADLHVIGPAHRAAVLDAGGLDAPEYGVEFLLRDAEAEVLDGEWSMVIDEIQRQTIVDVHGGERSGTGYRPGHAEQFRKALGRCALVSRGYDDVIELYCHPACRSAIVSEPNC